MAVQRSHLLIFLFVCLLGCLTVSGLHPYDRTTWCLEVFPIFIVLPILIFSYKKFPLSTLLYVCIFLHGLVLMVGGAYSYARVPLGFSIQEWFELTRNPYDKIGHFFQGFVPALVAREILLRKNIINGRNMLAFIVTCIVLAISASYELIEWAAAISLGQGADEFLGTQGDPWDTQSDMFFALIGATCAMLTMTRWQDAQIKMLYSN